MADEIKKIITIDTKGAVDSLKQVQKEVEGTGQSFNSLKEYKQHIDKLTASLLDLDSGSEEYVNTLNEISEAQENLNSVMQATKKDNSALEGSYNALSKKMAELKKTWKSLGEGEERNALGEQINDINDQLKELDQSIGNNQRNVGAYETAFTTGFNNIASTISALGNPLAIAKQGVFALSGAFKALMANPIVLLIGAIVLAIKGLVSAFKNSQQATDDLKVAFSAFEPIIGAIKGAFDKVVTGITGFVKKAIPMVVDGIIWMLEAIAPALEAIGVDVESKVNSLKEIKKGILDRQAATEAAIKAEREYSKVLTQRVAAENKITELQNKFDNTKSISEKLKLQKQITALANQQAASELKSLSTLIARKKIELKNNPKDEVAIQQELNELYEKQAEAQQWKQQQIQGTLSVTSEIEAQRTAQLEKQNELLEEQKKKEEELRQKVAEIEEEINDYKLDDIGKEIKELTDWYYESLAVMKQAGKDTTELTKNYWSRFGEIMNEGLKPLNEVKKRIADSGKSAMELELQKIEEQYEKDKALYIKHNQDLVELDKYYAKLRADIELKYKNKDLSGVDEEIALQQFIADKTIQNEFDKQEKILEIQRSALEQKKQILLEQLDIENLSAEQIKNIKSELTKVDIELLENQDNLRQNTIAKNADMVNSYASMASSIGSLMGDISSFIQDNIKAKLEAGEITEEQAKQEFENTKKAQIAATILTGLAGVAAAIASPAANAMGPAGWIAASIQAATVAATTAMQVAKIKQTTFDASSSSSSSNVSNSQSGVNTNTATQYSPTFTANINGNSDTQNLANAVEEGTAKGTQNIRVYVLESDIREAGTKVDVRDNESTF